MSDDNIRIGKFTGTGAALTVELGWIPDFVECTNATDGDVIDRWFRNDAAGTSLRIIDSGAGAVDLVVNAADGVTAFAGASGPGRSFAYTSGGTYTTLVGNTITGALSGAKGTVIAITLASGTFAGGDAAGVITVDQQSGVFQSENLNVGANSNVATVAGNTALVAKAPGFTVGTDISESAKVINFIAMRNPVKDYNDTYP